MAAEQASATALRQLNNDPRKCAICQKKTKYRLVTQHADSSKTNLFNYAVAKDDADIVQLINEHREDVTWHRNCYAVYTSKSHIQTDKRSTDAVSSGEDAVRDCKRQRSVVTCNVNQCLFCEKTYHGKNN